MDNLPIDIEYNDACQGEKTTFTNGYKKGDPSEKYFIIEQNSNKVFLAKEQVLMIVERGQMMVDRWKIGKKIHKTTGMRYKDNNG